MGGDFDRSAWCLVAGGFQEFVIERWIYRATEVPVPSVASLTRARIAQRFELQATRRNAQGHAVRQQPLAIGTHQMHHGSAEPDVPMQPDTAVHRVDHAVAALDELACSDRTVGLEQPSVSACIVRIFNNRRERSHRSHFTRQHQPTWPELRTPVRNRTGVLRWMPVGAPTGRPPVPRPSPRRPVPLVRRTRRRSAALRPDASPLPTSRARWPR